MPILTRKCLVRLLKGTWVAERGGRAQVHACISRSPSVVANSDHELRRDGLRKFGCRFCHPGRIEGVLIPNLPHHWLAAMFRSALFLSICFLAGVVAMLASPDHADAQFYRFGPRGGVSIQSPFFSMNVPTSPSYYGRNYYGRRYYGPTIAVPPIAPVPSYRYYGYSYYPGYPFGYSYSSRPYSYGYAPGTSSFRLEIRPGYPSYGYRSPAADPYAYRGNVITPSPSPDPYAVGRVPVDEPSPIDPVRLKDDLRIAAEQLRQSLALRRDDSDVWLDYLQPGAIIDALNDADASQHPGEIFRELVGHYDGVAGNPDLRSVASAQGFDRTRRLLRIWVEGPSATGAVASTPPVAPEAQPNGAAKNESDPGAGEESAVDGGELPVPQPDPVADEASDSASSKRRSL